jgi:hypothetical protein
MSTRTNRRNTRDYDAESGVRRVSRKEKKKVIVPDTESEPSDSEPEIQVARKKIVKKSFKEDARRKTYVEPSSDEEEEADAPVRRTKTTKQSGTANTDSATTSGSSVAPWISFFTAFDVFGISVPRHLTHSSFIPSAFMLFNILYGMEVSLNGNSRINNYDNSYFSLGPRIYYGFLYYYQILRARFAAGIPLDAIERRCLRKLETVIPLESCPVAGPLIPYFQTLGAYNPSDNMYGWIVPQFHTFVAGDNHSNWTRADSYGSPPVGHMVGYFASLAAITTTAQGQTFSNPQGFIIPVARPTPAAAVAWPVTNQNWETDGTTAMHASIQALFSRPGLNFALPEMASKLLTRSNVDQWKRLALPNVVHTTPKADLEQMLLLTFNTDWIKSMRDMAIAQAKFFKGSVNLSQISPTTTAAVTTLGELIQPAAAPNALVPMSQVFNGYDDLNAGFYAISGSLSDEEFKIGSMMSLIRGHDAASFFTPPAGWANAPTGHVTGPYFRYQAVGGAYTGQLRNRWRKVTASEENINFDLRTLVRMNMYSAMGEEPEPVRIMN